MHKVEKKQWKRKEEAVKEKRKSIKNLTAREEESTAWRRKPESIL